ncbi:MAG: hypothetical protein Q8M31_18340 [Beijerinckiaceae bacterium]|nr:hypothetical protein [Beijerinckiaceae bacterium]
MGATIMQSLQNTMRVGALAAATFAAAQSFATPASAGLLDLLFGRPQYQQQHQPQPQQRMIYAPQSAAVTAAKPARRVVRDVPRGPIPYVAPAVASGPLGRFLHDPSLRRGDVVATPNGLMVFQGRTGSDSHRSADFVSVGSAVAVSGARRADLLNLDRTVRSSSPNVEFVAEKVEPKALLIAKRADNDARSAVAAGN